MLKLTPKEMTDIQALIHYVGPAEFKRSITEILYRASEDMGRVDGETSDQYRHMATTLADTELPVS